MNSEREREKRLLALRTVYTLFFLPKSIFNTSANVILGLHLFQSEGDMEKVPK